MNKAGALRVLTVAVVAGGLGLAASVWLGNTRGLLPYSVLVDAQGKVVRQKLGPFAHGEIEGWARP